MYLSSKTVNDAGESQLRGVVEDELGLQVDLVAADAVDEDHLAVLDAYWIS